MNNKHIDLLRALWLGSGVLKDLSKEEVKNKLMEYADELYPYSKLPNVSELKITKLAEYHPVLNKYGIQKRQHAPEF